MKKIYLKTLEREVELLPRTYRIDRAFNEALFENVNIPTSQELSTVTIPAINTIKAKGIETQLLFGLTSDEMDRLTSAEITELQTAISEDETQKKS